MDGTDFEFEPGPKQRDLVTSLERGLRVLTAFDQNAVEMTPSDVSKKTDLPRAATRRILLTLCNLGYAASDGKRFRLTPKVLNLSHNYLRTDNVRNLIEPIVKGAVDKVRDSCTLNIRDGNDSLSILACNAASFNAVNMNVGLRIPLHVATPGRVMLASMSNKEIDAYLRRIRLESFTPHTIAHKNELLKELERVREQEYAIGREEWELGVYAISVPLQNHKRDLMACLTFVGNVARIQHQEEIELRLATLKHAAERIVAVLPATADIGEMLNFSPGG